MHSYRSGRFSKDGLLDIGKLPGERVIARVNRADGLFSGTASRISGGKKKFTGLLLQDRGRGVGISGKPGTEAAVEFRVRPEGQ